MIHIITPQDELRQDEIDRVRARIENDDYTDVEIGIVADRIIDALAPVRPTQLRIAEIDH